MLYNAYIRPDSLAYKLRSKGSLKFSTAFPSKNSLSEYSQVHPAPLPLLLPATTNITVQFETEKNSPSGGENYVAMTTLKKFNYTDKKVQMMC